MKPLKDIPLQEFRDGAWNFGQPASYPHGLDKDLREIQGATLKDIIGWHTCAQIVHEVKEGRWMFEGNNLVRIDNEKTIPIYLDLYDLLAKLRKIRQLNDEVRNAIMDYNRSSKPKVIE